MLAQDAGVARPFIMGHSLGGTLAAIFAASNAPSVRGLVLLRPRFALRREAAASGTRSAKLCQQGAVG